MSKVRHNETHGKIEKAVNEYLKRYLIMLIL